MRSDLQEAVQMGFEVGRNDPDIRAGRFDSDVLRDNLRELRRIAVFSRRLAAVSLTKSDLRCAKQLYRGCPTHNVKHVSPQQLDAYIKRVIPRSVFFCQFLWPVLLAFWIGVEQGLLDTCEDWIPGGRE
ncbi:MAG: hypothetical protein WC992_07075 [Acholeplasmataceae bacterium]|jgi:hypothetical protein